jgi:hypothetical protein
VYWERFDRWLPATVVQVGGSALRLRYPTGEEDTVALPHSSGMRFRVVA